MVCRAGRNTLQACDDVISSASLGTETNNGATTVGTIGTAVRVPTDWTGDTRS
jgi:hypothetical protein